MLDVTELLGTIIRDLMGVENHKDRLSITISAIRNLTLVADNYALSDYPAPSAFKFQRRPCSVEYLVLGEADGDVARRLHKERRARDDIFRDPTLFGEPAWDILLDAILAEIQRRPIQITSACIAAAVPATTALRWITLLVEKGYLSRVADEADRRRAFVRITKHGTAQMQRYFDRIAKLR